MSAQGVDLANLAQIALGANQAIGVLRGILWKVTGSVGGNCRSLAILPCLNECLFMADVNGIVQGGGKTAVGVGLGKGVDN